MNRCIVTGAAGFVGSTLCEALLKQGRHVIGIDCFVPYYPRSIKENNLKNALAEPRYTFHEVDLRIDDLEPLLQKGDIVFHEAAMAGLMKSWSDFDLYVSCNILATQRLLEAAVAKKISQLIYVSTSSVYGKDATGNEATMPGPYSPYGVTKCSAEHLCKAYMANFDLPLTILRYFSVYGPRQRPDMAYHILIKALLTDQPFTLYGTGEQTRSNTFISDCVQATLAVLEHREAALGETFNIGGGQIISLNEVVQTLQEITGAEAQIKNEPARPGDQMHTSANIEKAKKILGYKPKTPVYEGLKAQVEWQKLLQT